MRIAMLAPLYESVPPSHYGGTERIVSYLTEELVRRGHDVALFASGDSTTSATLIPVCESALRLGPRPVDPVVYHVLELTMALEQASDFDLIHSHCDFRAFPFTQLTSTPILSTNHNRLDSAENRHLVELFPRAPITALSRSHRRQLPSARCVGVAYNGIPVREFPFSPVPGQYLAFLGRLSPEKGPLEAIAVAERTGIPLKIAAKINEWERDYFESEIKPHLASPHIEYLGELNEQEKRAFLVDALAVLFPISWPEPFGMTMVEAMATGTPVLAFPAGAAPEVVDENLTGFLCADVAEMSERVFDAAILDRYACRAQVDRRFSDRAMADAYLEMYAALAAEAEPTGANRLQIAGKLAS